MENHVAANYLHRAANRIRHRSDRQVLRVFVGRAFNVIARQVGERNHAVARVLRDVRERVVDRGGGVVDFSHANSEGLRIAGIDAAVVGAAVVHEADGDGRRAVGIRRGGVGQVAARVDGRQAAEQAIVVGADQECRQLGALVRRPDADSGGPAVDRLRASIFEDALVAALGEARRVVDRVDGDGEYLRAARVLRRR